MVAYRIGYLIGVFVGMALIVFLMGVVYRYIWNGIDGRKKDYKQAFKEIMVFYLANFVVLFIFSLIRFVFVGGGY